MRKFIYSILFALFLADTNSYATISVISDDDNKTKFYKNGRTYLSQIWYGRNFEIDESISDGENTLKKVDSYKYEKYLNEVDKRVIEKIGDYKVYIIQNKLKDYKSFSGLSFLDNTTVIFGRYFEISDNNIAKLAVHELGHIVDFRLMNEEKWREYRKIRGITDEKIYNNSSEISANRPQEIFAEDFRFLFGGEDAKKSPHKNSYLEKAEECLELVNFFEKLLEL